MNQYQFIFDKSILLYVALMHVTVALEPRDKFQLCFSVILKEIKSFFFDINTKLNYRIYLTLIQLLCLEHVKPYRPSGDGYQKCAQA